jgi:hypothetical protein
MASLTRRALWAALSLCLFSGCVGQLGTTEPGPDMDGAVDRRDTGPRRDASGDGGPSTGEDAYVPPGTDAAPGDAHVPGPCDAVTCGANERCDASTASCICLPGFVSSGSSCVAAEPGDPSTRTVAEVCAAWEEGHRETATTAWVPGGGGDCDPGSMTPEAIDDTLRRINMFRWMIGLGPVVDRPEDHARQQECARMMDANNALSHSPPTGWECYTSEGAAGAGSSNLALGVSAAADTIDLYVGDNGVPSLGHRRWVFNGPLGSVGIGQVGRGGCLGVFHGGGSTSRTWTAWPPPGPVPLEAIGSVLWSFHSSDARGGSVRVVRVSDGSDLGVTPMRPPDGYGPSTVAWSSDGARTEGTYRVTVSGISLGEVTYDVNLVSCP